MIPVASLPVGDAASVFLREHAEGSSLFPAGGFASATALARRAAVLDAWDGDRAALAAFLAAEHAAGHHPAQADSLAAAARHDALFVLTGQQPGLLGGPALALHKALTTVAWARAAAARLGRPVIPVFWIAGDDSDLAESNTAEFLEPDAAVTATSLDFPETAAAIPMSLRLLDEAACRALRAALPASWSPEARALVDACYRPGYSLTEAFRAVMQRLLGPHGVLCVDGFAAARRPEAQAILRRVATAGATFQEALARGTTRLRDTLALPPQVPVRPGTVPVFLFENRQRVRLHADEAGRVYEAGREGLDLRPLLERHTVLHSALTRPLVVDALFPALGHVLGPAELRYFAQLADVFPAFGRTFPLLAPRQQALLIPDAALRELGTLGFTPADVPTLTPSRMRARLTETAWAAHAAADAFPDSEHDRLREALAGYQARYFPAAGNRFEAARRSLERALAHHRDTARALVFAESGRTRFEALQPLLRWLAGGSQDRHLNTLSLWNALQKGGPGTFDAYVAALSRTGDEVTVMRGAAFDGEST